MGFGAFVPRGSGRFSDEYLTQILSDNPRKSPSGQEMKAEIIRNIHNGLMDQQPYAYQFDMRLELQRE